MMDSNITARKQSAMVLAGVILVALAIAGGSWYGFKGASSPANVTNITNISNASGASSSRLQGAAPATGRLPNSSGIGQGETIVSKSVYARPPQVFDAIAAIASTASSPASGASGPTSPSPAATLKPAASSVNATPAADVLPAGWAGAGASLDRMWESNAVAAWDVRATPLTAPNWRISGVVQRGEQTQILVQFDGEPSTRFFKVGDVLPGGGKLAWVKPNVIGVSFPKQKPLTVPLVEDPFQPASSAGKPAAPAKARP